MEPKKHIVLDLPCPCSEISKTDAEESTSSANFKLGFSWSEIRLEASLEAAGKLEFGRRKEWSVSCQKK